MSDKATGENISGENEKEGYDVEFVDDVCEDKITCAICLLILREPMQAVPCGHRFCKNCIDKMPRQGSNHDLICPNDRGKVQVFADVGREREILDFVIKCTNNKLLCNWTGELRQLKNHIDATCPYHNIKCTNDGCDFTMLRKELQHHLNDVCEHEYFKCIHCDESVKRLHEMNHLKECGLFLLICENNCGKLDIPRNQMPNHLHYECPNVIVHCKYADIGCQVIGTKSFLMEHSRKDFDEHLKLQSEIVTKQKKRITKQEEQITKQEEKLTKQEQKLTIQEEKLTIQDDKISDILKNFDEMKNALMFPKCPFYFTVYNFASEFESSKATNKIIYTDQFYFLDGYRGKVRVQLNGHDQFKGTHISVIFYISKGPFDERLSWPMLHGLISISLFSNKQCVMTKSVNCQEHKDILKNVFIKRSGSGGTGYGFYDFCDHKNIPINIDGDRIRLLVDVLPL